MDTVAIQLRSIKSRMSPFRDVSSNNTIRFPASTQTKDPTHIVKLTSEHGKDKCDRPVLPLTPSDKLKVSEVDKILKRGKLLKRPGLDESDIGSFSPSHSSRKKSLALNRDSSNSLTESSNYPYESDNTSSCYNDSEQSTTEIEIKYSDYSPKKGVSSVSDSGYYNSDYYYSSCRTGSYTSTVGQSTNPSTTSTMTSPNQRDTKYHSSGCHGEYSYEYSRSVTSCPSKTYSDPPTTYCSSSPSTSHLCSTCSNRSSQYSCSTSSPTSSRSYSSTTACSSCGNSNFTNTSCQTPSNTTSCSCSYSCSSCTECGESSCRKSSFELTCTGSLLDDDSQTKDSLFDSSSSSSSMPLNSSDKSESRFNAPRSPSTKPFIVKKPAYKPCIEDTENTNSESDLLSLECRFQKRKGRCITFPGDSPASRAKRTQASESVDDYTAYLSEKRRMKIEEEKKRLKEEERKRRQRACIYGRYNRRTRERTRASERNEMRQKMKRALDPRRTGLTRERKVCGFDHSDSDSLFDSDLDIEPDRTIKYFDTGISSGYSNQKCGDENTRKLLNIANKMKAHGKAIKSILKSI